MTKNEEEEDERFTVIVDLLSHMCDELVDDPKSLTFNSAYTGVTGVIEVVGPQKEVSKIFGAHKATIMAIETVIRNVAAKNGFRILINILNDERKKDLQSKSVPFYEDED